MQAIRGVSLSIERGETLGLVGESGCGKSTLAAALSGSSNLRVAGLCSMGRPLEFVGGGSPACQTRHSDHLSGSVFFLDPRQRVGDIILEGLIIHDILSPSQRRGRVVELLESVGLKASHVNSYPHEFSGGQRQRIAIARALAVGPNFLSRTNLFPRWTCRSRHRS